MTWEEFKDFVDEELRKRGGSGETEVGWIDISWPTSPTLLEDGIEIEDEDYGNGLLRITG